MMIYKFSLVVGIVKMKWGCYVARWGWLRGQVSRYILLNPVHLLLLEKERSHWLVSTESAISRDGAKRGTGASEQDLSPFDAIHPRTEIAHDLA